MLSKIKGHTELRTNAAQGAREGDNKTIKDGNPCQFFFNPGFGPRYLCVKAYCFNNQLINI
jgi:hypothetical protein